MRWRKTGHKKKILLIYPRAAGTVTSNDAFFPFPFLSLTQIAATIPTDYQVEIIDERLSPVNGHESVDLVFITVLTSNVYRAYDLGQIFEKRGVPVVMGGPHATALYQEASQYATSVAIGEADDMVEHILTDFEKGRLAATYRGTGVPELDDTSPPHIDLLNWRHRFFMIPIQTSRGCPNDCDFCAVPKMFGRKLREKSLATIEKELQYLSRFRSRQLFVVDDNFTIKKDRALILMDMFRHYGFKWMGFSTLSISEDEKFLRGLQKSGCVSLFIGFESVGNPEGILKNHSYRSSAAMRAAVDRIHAHHIGIQGSFICGFDHDDVTVFQKTASFIQETGIELPNICILTPFPGTPLFDSLERKQRIIHKNWSEYDMSHVVFEPQNMTAAELQQGYAWTLKYLAAPTTILARLNKRTSSKLYFLTANFSLHRAQTRLAHSLWNPAVQTSLQKRHLCPC